MKTGKEWELVPALCANGRSSGTHTNQAAAGRGVLPRGQALQEEEGARARNVASPRVPHTVTGRGHPHHPPCPGLGVHLQTSGGRGLGQDHPPDRKVGGEINPLAAEAQHQALTKRGAQPALPAKGSAPLPYFPQRVGTTSRGHQRHGQARPGRWGGELGLRDKQNEVD